MQSIENLNPAEILNSFKELNIAITITDINDNIIYMNDKAASIFSETQLGDNLMQCHTQSSNEIINTLKKENKTNTYTINKNGIKKLIHQTP